MLTQLADSRRIGRIVGDAIRDEALLSREILDRNCCLLDIRIGFQRSLNLFKLNTETPILDLAVGAAH